MRLIKARKTVPLILSLAALLPACKSDPLPDVLGVQPEMKAQYKVQDTQRQDYGGKPRVSMTITVPKGLSKADIEAQVRHAIYTAYKSSVVTPGAIRVRAYQDKVEDRPYTAALGLFSPDGRWTGPDPRTPTPQWKVSLAVRDWYLRGEAPPDLEAKKAEQEAKALAEAQALLDAAPAAAPDAGVEEEAPMEPVLANLKVFAIDHKGQPVKGGTLRIDDKETGETPWTGQVPEGKRKISVNWRFTLANIVAGRDNTITIKLPPPQAAAKKTSPLGGQLAKAKIVAGIQRDIHGLRNCYEKELKKDQFLKGKVVVGFTIDQDGVVAKAGIQSSELGKQVDRCIVSRVKRLKFPKPEGGSVEVTYPLNFRPKA